MTKKYLSGEDILKLAEQSAIYISDSEVLEYTESLNDIIGYIEQIHTVDTTDSDSVSEYILTVDDLREDIVDYEFSRDSFINNVPESVGGLTKVPSIIKG